VEKPSWGSAKGRTLTTRRHRKRDARERHARLHGERGVVVVCTDAMTDAMRTQPGLGSNGEGEG